MHKTSIYTITVFTRRGSRVIRSVAHHSAHYLLHMRFHLRNICTAKRERFRKTRPFPQNNGRSGEAAKEPSQQKFHSLVFERAKQQKGVPVSIAKNLIGELMVWVKVIADW